LSNEAKNRSIVQKIALQMNCKMGGTLWSVKIPLDNVMICGIDTFHAAGNKNDSVSGFVASINSTYTKWFSRAVIQNKKEEFVNGLISSLKGALEAYKSANHKLPAKIIIYRFVQNVDLSVFRFSNHINAIHSDGVGDGQLRMCKEYEIPQLQDACKLDYKDYDPDFTYIVVQKRINTRIFLRKRNELDNPLPGAVLDHTVTRKYMYDFFLVPQSVRQGTVTPTHYIVVHDSANFSPDILQRLSYKLCFLYYNWPGTVRVPACCQVSLSIYRMLHFILINSQLNLMA
jgi:aubergine